MGAKTDQKIGDIVRKIGTINNLMPQLEGFNKDYEKALDKLLAAQVAIEKILDGDPAKKARAAKAETPEDWAAIDPRLETLAEQFAKALNIKEVAMKGVDDCRRKIVAARAPFVADVKDFSKWVKKKKVLDLFKKQKSLKEAEDFCKDAKATIDDVDRLIDSF